MNSPMNRHRIELLACFLAPSAAVAVMLTAGLGSFGMWEPHETQHVQNASALTSAGAFSLGDSLSSAGASALGNRDVGARLPSAALAFIAALGVGLTALVLGGRRFSLFALLALVSAPVFLFHGRQATGGAPLLASETLAFAGLALAALGEGRLTAVGGIAAAAIGLPVATLCAGSIIGIAVPTGSIAVALLSSGARTTERRKRALVASAVLCAGGIAAFSIVAAIGAQIPAITAGLAEKPAPVDCSTALGQLAYGWFPWIALLPVALIGRAGAPEEDARRRAIRALAVGGVALGLVGQTFYTALHGSSPLFLAVPVAFGTALALEDLEASAQPQRFAALAAIAAVLVMARDFAQQPSAILTAYALPSLKAPDVFKPFVGTIIAAAPFLVFVIVAGFVRGGEGVLRRMRVRVLAPVAAIAFGGFVAFSLVPELSVHFSPKHALQAYERFATKGEPLAVFGAPSPEPGGKVLGSRGELVSWLSRKDRVFALLPPRELPQVDQEYRAARGEHVFVLDMASTRLILATSRPKPKERSVNPIARDVSSTPFPNAPANPMQVNFDDKLTLLGWDVESPAGKGALKRGAEFTLTFYWHCEARVPRSYKAFVHIDGKGPRINGDHEPLDGAYPTQNWNAGDYVRDVFHGSVAAVQESGAYTIRTGLFRGSSRLAVVGLPPAQENSVLLGTVQLK
jgi:4-amino-4-deoxy-L-arabinose transferase-like glycosyltransferase